ncbi:MAG: hypothetical protein IPH72_07980 [Sandaracinaceae bacterium]|nr:hypothetical protein [Sandaracinaceae bacterium]
MLITDVRISRDLVTPPASSALAGVDPAEVLVQLALAPAARREAAEGLASPVRAAGDQQRSPQAGPRAREPHLRSQGGHGGSVARAALQEGAWIGRSCHDAQ